MRKGRGLVDSQQICIGIKRCSQLTSATSSYCSYYHTHRYKPYKPNKSLLPVTTHHSHCELSGLDCSVRLSTVYTVIVYSLSNIGREMLLYRVWVHKLSTTHSFYTNYVYLQTKQKVVLSISAGSHDMSEKNRWLSLILSYVFHLMLWWEENEVRIFHPKIISRYSEHFGFIYHSSANTQTWLTTTTKYLYNINS